MKFKMRYRRYRWFLFGKRLGRREGASPRLTSFKGKEDNRSRAFRI